MIFSHEDVERVNSLSKEDRRSIAALRWSDEQAAQKLDVFLERAIDPTKGNEYRGKRMRSGGYQPPPKRCKTVAEK